MAKVQNTFLKSKMNKDLDARILPNGEYRDAQNAQISKSESANVGNLENILGRFFKMIFARTHFIVRAQISFTFSAFGKFIAVMFVFLFSILASSRSTIS